MENLNPPNNGNDKRQKCRKAELYKRIPQKIKGPLYERSRIETSSKQVSSEGLNILVKINKQIVITDVLQKPYQIQYCNSKTSSTCSIKIMSSRTSIQESTRKRKSLNLSKVSQQRCNKIKVCPTNPQSIQKPTKVPCNKSSRKSSTGLPSNGLESIAITQSMELVLYDHNNKSNRGLFNPNQVSRIDLSAIKDIFDKEIDCLYYEQEFDPPRINSDKPTSKRWENIDTQETCSVINNKYNEGIKYLWNTILCKIYDIIFVKKKKQVPCLFNRDWCTKDLSHGCLLSLYLKTNSVALLSTLSNSHFVITTTFTPNVTIHFYFKLSNVILRADAEIYRKPFKLIFFNEEHRKVLLRTNTRAVFINECNLKKESVMGFIRQDLRIIESVKSVCCSESTQWCEGTSLSTVKLVKDSVSEGSLSLSYTDSSEYFDYYSCSSVASVKESFSNVTPSVNNITSYYMLVRKDCGDMNLRNFIEDLKNEELLEEQPWFLKQLHRAKNNVKFLNKNMYKVLDDVINEELFDLTTVDVLDNLCECWDELSFENLCVSFVNDFGQRIVHTLFSATVPLI